MNVIAKSHRFQDIPTPTKDEPVPNKTCICPTTGPTEDPNCSLDVSRDSVTPTLDEPPLNPNCPTPTVDEPVEKFTNPSPDRGLTVEEVKCKLFDRDASGGNNSSASVQKTNSNSDANSSSKDADASDTKPSEEGSSGVVATLEKSLPNGNISDESRKHCLSKTMSSEVLGDSEEQKHISVTCNGELFTCNECAYTNKGHHFEEHLMCHLISKPYQCLYCKDAFASRREIGKHLSSMHKGKKLNCMLKALNRAKTLMHEAQKATSCIFLAHVHVKRKRNLSTESAGSVGSLSRSTSDSDGSQRSVCSLPPSRQTSQLSEEDTKEMPNLSAQDRTQKLSVSNEVSHEQEPKKEMKVNSNVENISFSQNTSEAVGTENKQIVTANLCSGLDVNNEGKVPSVVAETAVCEGGQEKMKVDAVVDKGKYEVVNTKSINETIDNGNSETVVTRKFCETADKGDSSETVDSETHVKNIGQTDENRLGEALDDDFTEAVAEKNFTEVVDSKNINETVSDNICETTDRKNISETIEQGSMDEKENIGDQLDDTTCSEERETSLAQKDALAAGKSETKEKREPLSDECEQITSDPVSASEASEAKCPNSDEALLQVSASDSKSLTKEVSVDHQQSTDLCEEVKKPGNSPDDDLTCDEGGSENEITNKSVQLELPEENQSSESSNNVKRGPADELSQQKQFSGSDTVRSSEENSVEELGGGETGNSSVISADNLAVKQSSSDKVSGESNSMGIKIVASFSLDGDDYTKSEEGKGDINETGENKATADSNDKTTNDTSGLVIDVFKDGRIAVHDTITKSSAADKIDTSPSKPVSDDKTSVVEEPEPKSKLHQTKLGQLLAGTAFPTVVSSSSVSNETSSAVTSTISTTPVTSISPESTTRSVSVSSSTATPTQAQSGPAPVMTAAQIKHMRNPNFYVCGLNCNFSCLNSVEFRDHLFLGHAGEKSFPCYYCGWLAHTEESLLRHITNHAHTYSRTVPLYMCGMHRCRFGTNLLSDLLNHMQILHNDITEYICKECNDTFSTVQDLVSHFEDNFIHVVNCPHCACKGTDRRMILKHIAEYHPGKAKMVSVAKQIICKDRKVNNYKQIRAQYKSGVALLSKGVTGTESSSPERRFISGAYTSLRESETTKTVVVKKEGMSKEGEYGINPLTATSDSSNTSPGEKQIQAPKCNHCTFVARDQRRLESHVKCHGLPVIKRHRFRCLYCPQGFDSCQKFRLHINCHPGLIKYWMYYCKRCDFDTNQRYVILRHIRTRDEVHINDGNEEDMFTVVERILESRVLECEHCNYQTRHKLHLQIHYQREHKVIKAAAHSSSDSGKPKIKQQVPWTSPTHSSLSTDSCQENMLKKFKCPFCRYLVPKAADLKSHVKKHANLGKITIDFLRCRYCSLSSTARDIVYNHMREKHAGKPLVLVRKIVTIDCSGTDNSFSETSVTEAPLTVSSSSHSIDKFQCETCSFATVDRQEFESHVQLHNTTKGGIHGLSVDEDSDEEDEDDDVETGVDHPQPASDDVDEDTKQENSLASQGGLIDVIEQVYVIPETVAGDQLSSPARCCNCYYASGYRSAFIDHMTANHPDVMLVVRNKGTTVEQICPNGRMFFGLPVTLNNEVLLVPDRQVFTQAVKCPKCPNFASYFRRNLVLHLSKDHSEITAMGKCTWPGWQASSGSSNTSQAPASTSTLSPKIKSPNRPTTPPENQDESCIIGSGDLDEQIACLYKNFGDRQQCLICNTSKPKKFFMHIHILRHLGINLVKCPYCPHKGLQKYKIGRHIRTNHPERENVVKDIKTDIPKKVADFLAHQKKVVAAAVSPLSKGSSIASLQIDPSMVSPKAEKDACSVNKMSGPLGTPYLDEKLLCLYTPTDGKNKCNLCSVEFARKYAIHRHIVVNHLKVSLLKCGYCDFQAVEKHVVIDHILEQHKNQQIQFEPLDINMEQKVQEFLSTYNVVKSEPEQDTETSYELSAQKSIGPQAYCLGKDKLHNKLFPLFTKKGDSFKCNLCKWKFPRKYAIHRHILMKHLKIGLYGCTHCHVQGAEKYIVVAHMKEAHPKVPPQARALEVDMDQRIQEVLHEAAYGIGNHTSGRMPRKTSYSAEPSDTENTTEDSKTFIKKTENTDQKPMVVAMFGKKRKPSPEPRAEGDTTVTPKKLKTTSRMVDVSTKIKVVCVEDGTFKKYVCEKCRFTSLHRSNVYRHVLRIHEKYRELQCDRCGYKTYSKVLLDQHMEVEHDGIYPNSADSKNEMIASVKQEPDLMEEDKKTDITDTTSTQPVKHYACAYCNFETSTAENIIKHTRENHAPGGGETKQTGNLETSESLSDSVTVSTHEYVVKKSSVKRGTFTESQMLYCGYCTFKAPGVQAVKDHHKEKHQPNKLCIISPQQWRYICRVCGLKNNAGSKMRSHLNRHLEYRPYSCTSCNQSYASTDELRKHVRNLRHSENFQYLKHEKKEQKINRFLEESRKNALLVNIGAPPGEESMGAPSAAVSCIDEILDLKEPPQSPEPKFKGIKRTMKMPMSPTKSLQKKYWKSGLDRESKAITKDIACNWCDIPHTVSVDQMKQHHFKEHPEKDFLWVDMRQGHTCRETGDIVITGHLTETPEINDLYTSKQLANNKIKYYCTRCSFSAWYLPAMVSHCRCHQPKKYLCAYCHLRYSNRDYLERHQSTFHPQRDPWILHMVEGDSSSNTLQTSTVNSADTREPKKEVMSDEETPAPVDERRISQSVMYCCNFCPFQSESLYQYRLHLPVHGTFKHLKTDLSNDSPLKCGFCPYVAQDQNDFSLHITSHFENRSFKCAHCTYSAYTRGHVRLHSANQHPDLEQRVLDLSSAASYVEYLKADTTNLPKLVDLDPRVVLQDIKSMRQTDLEALINKELNEDLNRDEDEFVDVEGLEEEAPVKEAVTGDKLRLPEEQKVEEEVIKATSPVSQDVQTVDSSVEVDETSAHQEQSGQDSISGKAATPAQLDKSDFSGIVSSSVGTDEEGAGNGFDIAEVSAFVEDSDTSKLSKSDTDHDDSVSAGDESVNISGVKSFDNSTNSSMDTKIHGQLPEGGDEVDGHSTSNTASSSNLLGQSSGREKTPDFDDKVKKDDSANVFDTLNSWLGMK